MRLFNMLLASAALVGASSAANATVTVYTTQASFLAATSAAGVDTYNDLIVTPYATPISRTAGAYSYTASVGPNSNFFPAGSTSDAWLASNSRLDTITFSNFTASVRGVGGFFFRSDIDGLATTTAGTLTLVATDASGATTRMLVNPTQTTFLGFVSNGQLTSVALYVGTQGVGTQGVWPTINNLTLAQGAAAAAVPEAATWAMMLAGFGMIGAATRYRRRSTTTSFA